MLGNRQRSGMLDTLILGDGMYENIKKEAMKRMIQGLTLSMAEHQRENMELSAIHFEPVCTLSAVISRSVAYQEMKCIAECKMAAFYISEPKQQLKHKFNFQIRPQARIIQLLLLRKAIIHYSGT